MGDCWDDEIRMTMPDHSKIFNSSPNFEELLENEKSYLEQENNMFHVVVFTREIMSFF